MTTSSKDLWSAALNTLTESDRQKLSFHEGQDELSVLTDLQELTERAKEQCVKKRWRLKMPGRNGETVVLRDIFAKMVHWIDAFKQIGDIIVQYDPGHAALPWAGVRFILQIAVGDIVKFGFVVEGAESIARMIGRYTVFEEIYLRSASKASTELESALVQLYSTILMYQSKAKHFFDQSFAKRIIRSAFVTEDDMGRLAKKMDVEQSIVDRCAATFNTENQASIKESLGALSISQYENHARLKDLLQSIDGPVLRMSSQLNEIEDNLDKSKRHEILRWLSAQPHHEHHEQIRKKALAGTGRWLVGDSTYAEWHKGSTSSLLWLHGKVGAGKSTLASIVVEDAIRRSEAGRGPPPVYFYCARDAAEPQRSDAAAILSSIVRQLSCAEPGLPLLPPVVETYEKKGQGFNSRGLQIDDSCDIIKKLIEYYPMTTIIIDALDECNSEEREKLLDAVEGLLKDSSFGLLKVFLSSRDDQDIACTLREYPNVDLVSSRNSADIEAFVREETNRLVKKQRLLRNSNAKETMVALIIDEVSSGADGMFRWASLQLEMLCRMRTDQDVRQRLGRMPPKLEQLYEEIYRKTLNESQGEVGRSIISNTLKWLLCAQRPMKTSEFCTAVVWKMVPAEELTKEKVLDLCHNFVVLDSSLDVFRFAHLSVREFLEKQAEFTANSCHLFAAEICLLQFIGLSDCLAAKALLRDHFTLELRSKAASTAELLAGFHSYAAMFWARHCQLIGEEGRDSNPCFKRIFRFFLFYTFEKFSPLSLWVQYVKRMRSWSFLPWEIQGCGYRVACFYGFCEIICMYLREKLPRDWDMGWRLALKGGEVKASKLIMSACNEADISLDVVGGVIDVIEADTLDWVLRKGNLEVPDLLGYLVAKTNTNYESTVEGLITRYKPAEVSQAVIEYAASFCSASTIELLLRQNNDSEDSWDWDLLIKRATDHGNMEILRLLPSTKHFEITPYIVESVAGSGEENDMQLLLARDDTSEIISQAIDASASNRDEKVLGLLIDRAAPSRIVVSKEAIRRAIENPNEKILSLLLDNGYPISESLVNQAASSGYLSSLRLLLGRGGLITSSVLRFAAGNARDGANVMALLLAEADDFIVMEEMMEMMKIAVSWQNTSVIRLLLDRVGDMLITEDVLASAALHDSKGEMIKLLYGRGWEMTTEVLEAVMKYVTLGEVLQLVLDRPKDFELTGKVLLAAANNYHFGDRLVAQLLDKVNLHDCIDELLVEAAGNNDLGMEIIRLIQPQIGYINVSQEALERAARFGSVRTMAFLLDHTSAPTTEAIAVRALMSDQLDMVRLVFDRATNLPITRIMVSATVHCDCNQCLSFLWDRVCTAEMSEDATRDLAQAAIEVVGLTNESLKIFLDQVKDVVLTPKAILNIASSTYDSVPLLELLIDHGAIVQITREILQAAAISNKSALITFLLERSDGIELTDDIFKAAAGTGNKEVLQVLSKYGDLAEVSEKWLDIVRLHEILNINGWSASTYAKPADIDLQLDVIEELIGRGVELDTPDVYGNTPLFLAVYHGSVLTVQALLSAGANPSPTNKAGETPLHHAASWGCFAIVEMLLDLGVATHVEDKNRQTPASLAKGRGHIKIFRLLERRKQP